METHNDELPRDWREGRRFRALELPEAGWIGERIADALGVTAGAVSQWLARARVGGREALRTQPPPGPTPKLTADQRAARPALLARGAEAYDFVGDVWTAKRVAVVINRVLGVRDHPAQLSRLLRQVGLSVQQPVVRAHQRNEAQLAAWQAERWPAREAKPTPKAARSCS